ncbi:MAG: hypothetical protein ACOC1X_01590 [Promethearchaeota archaeon]
MGTPHRAKNMAKQLCLSERQLDAIEDDDTARYFTLAIYQILTKCGNCGKRMKCATDEIEILKRKGEIDVKNSEYLARLIFSVFDAMDEVLEEEQQIELIEKVKDETGLTIDELISAINEMFGECEEYNMNDVETIFSK